MVRPPGSPLPDPAVGAGFRYSVAMLIDVGIVSRGLQMLHLFSLHHMWGSGWY